MLLPRKRKPGQIITIVKNISKNYKAKDLKVKVSENDCWEVISHVPDNAGYGQFRKKRVHVLMYEKYFGQIPKGLVVRHKCDNKICCNPLHLELGTTADNNHDKLIRHGDSSILSYEKAKQIAECNDTIKNIMKLFNVSYDIVWKIKNNITWKNEFNIAPLIEFKQKLSESDVIDIYTSKESGTIIAKKYNISPNTVYDIRKKRTWTHITNKIGGK